MAIREIRLSNDEILRKTSREVETVDDRIKELLDDMNFSNVKCYPDPAFVFKGNWLVCPLIEDIPLYKTNDILMLLL